MLWYQKSTKKWVKYGDRNTSFFHAYTIIRSQRNKIHGLFLEEGTWSTMPEKLWEEAVTFVRSLFNGKTL